MVVDAKIVFDKLIWVVYYNRTDRRSIGEMPLMSTVKEGEVRRREILLAARNLFVNKGYEHTSINDILHVVDIAKGTFYYYFKSKEEVLETIILDIVEEGARKAEHILQDKSIPIVKRLILATLAQAPDFEGSEEIKEELHKVENTKLQQLYLEAMLERMTPVMVTPLIEGIEQGAFHTEYPTECIEQILLLSHVMFDRNPFHWAPEEYPHKLQAFLSNCDKILETKSEEFCSMAKMFGQIS